MPAPNGFVPGCGFPSNPELVCQGYNGHLEFEDNNLSILTEKRVRRNWEITDVAKSFKIESYTLNDSPLNLFKHSKKFFKKPYLLNVKTHRIYWHAGAGKDSEDTFDRYDYEKKQLGKLAIQFDQKIKKEMEDLWIKQLKKQ